MKSLQRSELSPVAAEELKDSRFALLELKMFGDSEIIAHGNDPIAVSQGGVPVKRDVDGKPLSPHRLKPQAKGVVGDDKEVVFNRGDLYRLD